MMKKGYRADALHGDVPAAARPRDEAVQVEAFAGPHRNGCGGAWYRCPGRDPRLSFQPAQRQRLLHPPLGRTAAGKKGVSIIHQPARKAFIGRMEIVLGIDFMPISIPDAKAIAAARLDRWAQVIEREEKPRTPPWTCGLPCKNGLKAYRKTPCSTDS